MEVNEDVQLKGTWKESFKDKVNPVTEAHRTWTGTRNHLDKDKPWYWQIEKLKIQSHIRMVAGFHCNDLGTVRQTICKCANHLKTLCKEDLEAAANCLLDFACKSRDRQQIIFIGWLKNKVDTSFRSIAKQHHRFFIPGTDTTNRTSIWIFSEKSGSQPFASARNLPEPARTYVIST